MRLTSSILIVLLSLASALAATPAELERAVTGPLTELRAVAEGAIDDLKSAERQVVDLSGKVNALELSLSAANAEIARLKATTQPTSYTVKPGGNINAAFAANTVVTVAPGTYTQAVNVPAGKTLKLGEARITKSVTISGTLVGGTVSDVSIPADRYGLIGRPQAAVRLIANGATVKGTVIERIDGVGISSENVDGIVVDGITVQDTTASAYLFGGGESKRFLKGTITNNAFRRFNTAKINVGGGPGINKITRSDELTFTGNTISDGAGPGVWLDAQNSRYLIANNTIDGLRGNTEAKNYNGIGVYVEISDGNGGLVKGNKITRTTGASISIAESTGVTVEGNTYDNRIEVRNMAGRAYGVVVNGVESKVPMRLADVLIKDNKGPKADHLSDPGSAVYAGNPAKYFADNNVTWSGNVK